MIKKHVLWYCFVECDVDIVKGVSVDVNPGGWFYVVDGRKDVE